MSGARGNHSRPGVRVQPDRGRGRWAGLPRSPRAAAPLLAQPTIRPRSLDHTNTAVNSPHTPNGIANDAFVNRAKINVPDINYRRPGLAASAAPLFDFPRSPPMPVRGTGRQAGRQAGRQTDRKAGRGGV